LLLAGYGMQQLGCGWLKRDAGSRYWQWSSGDDKAGLQLPYDSEDSGTTIELRWEQ
jgi:hypothetical protein